MSSIHNAAGGSTSDLLSAIYKVEVRNEEKISEEDRGFCQEQQDKLYKSLDQLKRWYDLFAADAEQYKEGYKTTFAANGSVKANELHSFYREDYRGFEFTPFSTINDIVQLHQRAVSAFARRIVEYFNKKYGVVVPIPDVDKQTFPMSFHPLYTTYVDQVIQHLGGRSFRSTAEDELIRRFHNVVKPSIWSNAKAELNGSKISFPEIINFDPFYYENYKRNHIHYNSTQTLEPFCAGIAFGADNTLQGSSSIIMCFSSDDVNVKEWYDLTTDDACQLKFYKNGRIDVKFKDALAAGNCYARLLLHKIEMPNNE